MTNSLMCVVRCLLGRLGEAPGAYVAVLLKIVAEGEEHFHRT